MEILLRGSHALKQLRDLTISNATKRDEILLMRSIDRDKLRGRRVGEIPREVLLKTLRGNRIGGDALRALCVRVEAHCKRHEERESAHRPNHEALHAVNSTAITRCGYLASTMNAHTSTTETTASLKASTTSGETNAMGAMVADSLRLTLHYGEEILKSIPAERFCEIPLNDMNHPAFCVGHLAIYANKVLEIVGRPELKVTMPFGDEHFKNGVQCVAQDGRYPSKDVIVGAFRDAWTVVLKTLPQVSDTTMRQINPMEGGMRERFPTAGSVVNFLAGPHNMMHLGQVSTWRRAAGLGSAM